MNKYEKILCRWVGIAPTKLTEVIMSGEKPMKVETVKPKLSIESAEKKTSAEATEDPKEKVPIDFWKRPSMETHPLMNKKGAGGG